VASRLDNDFKEHLKQQNGIAEIRTEDRSVAWRFSISQGKLHAARGCHPIPDYELVYKDVPTAVKVMSEGSEEASMQAIVDGNMRFDGDLTFGMWFNELLQKLGALIKEKAPFLSK